MMKTGLPIEDLIATATAYTAVTIAEGIERFVAPKFKPDECLVSGGGVHNPLLMAELQGLMPAFCAPCIDQCVFVNIGASNCSSRIPSASP